MSVVTPGDDLGSTAVFRAGAGTYARGGRVFAAIVGTRCLVSAPPPGPVLDDADVDSANIDEEADSESGAGPAAASTLSPLPMLTVSRGPEGAASEFVPRVGALVIARVTRINFAAASCDVLLCEGRPLAAPFSALIRREHVRDVEVDKVKIEDFFRPGDLVQAVVASLGDARSLFLSTIALAHGVVYARAEAAADGSSGGVGRVMRAVAGADGVMEDPVSGRRERRKVARAAE